MAAQAVIEEGGEAGDLAIGFEQLGIELLVGGDGDPDARRAADHFVIHVLHVGHLDHGQLGRPGIGAPKRQRGAGDEILVQDVVMDALERICQFGAR